MPTKTKVPPPAARKPESAAVRKARSNVNAAANEFETTRAAIAEAGRNPVTAKDTAALENARIIYHGMGVKLKAAQDALATALAGAK